MRVLQSTLMAALADDADSPKQRSVTTTITDDCAAAAAAGGGRRSCGGSGGIATTSSAHQANSGGQQQQAAAARQQQGRQADRQAGSPGLFVCCFGDVVMLSYPVVSPATIKAITAVNPQQ